LPHPGTDLIAGRRGRSYVQERLELQPTDLELVRKAARGDGDAFHALVDRHAAELFRLAASLSAVRADAEDVVQETFVGAYQGLKRFDGRASVKTWLKRILVRQAARAWNRSRRSRSALPLEGAAETAIQKESISATAMVDGRIDVAGVLGTLAPEHREVIAMREFEDMSYTEMAEVLGIPQGTVESRLHRARADLRKKLSEYSAK
jgi:RNA polymerase sigma-70 factor, ECF subfamily